MKTRTLTRMALLPLVVAAFAATRPCPAADLTDGLRGAFDNARAELRKAEERISTIQMHLEEERANVDRLEAQFRAGGNPRFIARALDAVEARVDKLEKERSEVADDVDAAVTMLLRIREAARRLRDVELVRAVERQLHFAAQLEDRLVESLDTVNEIQDAIEALRRRLRGAA